MKDYEFDVLYLDSNIFLNPDAKDLILRIEGKAKIAMPKEQYREINKLKSSDDEVGKKARDAFKIIENLLDNEVLNIEDPDESEGQNNSYADPVFVKKILNNLSEEKKVFFISEDRDLRIRLKIKLTDNPEFADLLTIGSMTDFIEYDDVKRTNPDYSSDFHTKSRKSGINYKAWFDVSKEVIKLGVKAVVLFLHVTDKR